MKQLFNLFPNKICKFGVCLALACTLCALPAAADPAASEQSESRGILNGTAVKEADPQHDSLINEQPDSSPAKVKLQDYIEEATLQSKTFLFPQDAFQNQGGTTFNAYRRYLYNYEKTPQGDVPHFRHYEFGLTKDQQKQTFPYELPVCSGRGFNFIQSQNNIIATFDEMMDGTELVFCAVPPLDSLGKVYVYKGACCKLGQKLFTVKTPAGTFKDCLSATSCDKDGAPVDGANLTFYAPKVGEILNLVYDGESQQYKVKAIMVGCKHTEEPNYFSPALGLSINKFMCAPNLSDKIFALTCETGKSPSCTVYKLIHPQGFGRSIVYWQRFDKVEELKAADKIKNPPVKGVDFIDAETNSVLRMSDEDPAPNTVIPPLESAGGNYQFNHKWYKLDSRVYNITTNAGKFDNCLQVTFFGDTPDVLDNNSYRAYYVHDLGEICREYYNSKTKEFEGDEILLKFSVGTSKLAPVQEKKASDKEAASKEK